jgi:hypothetical protein
MRSLIFGLVFLMGSAAFANTVIYKCAPSGDDGDAFGETLVMGFDVTADNKPATLNLISNYFGFASSPIAAVATAGPNGLFQAFSAPTGDPKLSYTRGLMVTMLEADKFEKFEATLKAEVTTRGVESGDSKVTYKCKRISE